MNRNSLIKMYGTRMLLTLCVIYGLPLVCKQDFFLMREGSAVIYPAS
jgi:hypothetical protein